MADKGMSRRELFGMFRRSVERAAAPAPESALDGHDHGPPQRATYFQTPLRPPGAGPELTIADTCIRCGLCVEICPRQAIKPLPDEYGSWAGTPYIVPREAPCVLCEGLRCTHVCPSGALRPLHANHDVQMGLAVLSPGRCLAWQGSACTECHTHCPVDGAITLDEQGRPQIRSSCTGCGLCEHYCPTEPRAVQVRPREAAP